MGPTELLDLAIDAHGGRRRWEDISQFRATASITGAILAMKGKPGLLDDVVLEGTTREEYRTWLRTLFTDLSRAAGASNPKRLGRQLALLYDGAAVAARLDADRSGAAEAARSAATALLDAATVRQPRRPAKCPRTNNASIEARRLISLHPTESDLPGKIIRERALRPLEDNKCFSRAVVNSSAGAASGP